MKKIYIIEDEGDINNLYSLLFQREGIEIEDIVTSGKVAVDNISQFDEAKIKDLVFLIDNRIPEKAGIEVAKQLIEMSAQLKDQIIIATADDTLTRKEVQGLGIKYFLRKPFSLDDLLEMIEKICKE